MRYNRFGSTGLIVSELCLGAMTFGSNETRWSAVAGLDEDASTALVRQAVDAGINFIDTANVYSNGVSEQLVGAAIKRLGLARQDIVIATKGAGQAGAGPNGRGTSRHHLLSEIDLSLERLGVDHVDLYQLHVWDPVTPLEETLSALNDIVRSGRARYIGVSNWAAWQITKALGISERKGLAAFASVQSYYSLVGRDLERELIPMIESERLGLMIWSPLASGLLSGKYTLKDGQYVSEQGRRAQFAFPPVNNEQAGKALAALERIANARGAPVASIALAWLLHKKAISSVIVGAKRADQLADNIAACDVTLDEADMASLDQATALEPEYPVWMMNAQGSRSAMISPPRHPSGEMVSQ